MEDFKIDNSTVIERMPRAETKYNFHKVEVGKSILVLRNEGETKFQYELKVKRARQAAYAHAKYFGKKFVSQKENGIVRIIRKY